MKKLVKIAGVLLLALILLPMVFYFGFLGFEYITGASYVDYLNANKETVPIDGSFTFEMMSSDLENHNLILVGEIHGLHEPNTFDVQFFKHLHKNYGVRHYFAELDFAQAAMLNDYMETGNDSLLSRILENWVVAQGRNNSDYLNKFKTFHLFYQSLPPTEKFQFVGIDKVQDWPFLVSYVNRLSQSDTTVLPLKLDDKVVLKVLKERVMYLTQSKYLNDSTQDVLSHILKNIEYYQNKEFREVVLFENFKRLYTDYQLSDKRVYGFFGLYHIFQYRINGAHPFASMVRTSNLGLATKILSINFLFTESYMVMDSKQLPDFLRDPGPYTKMPVSADNIWMMYIYGIRDFKRSTPEYQKSLIKMNHNNSPYKNSSRLNSTFRVFPVTDIFEMTDKGEAYVQYTVFVRNSDWAEPVLD